jgi:hypothetical protein
MASLPYALPFHQHQRHVVQIQMFHVVKRKAKPQTQPFKHCKHRIPTVHRAHGTLYRGKKKHHQHQGNQKQQEQSDATPVRRFRVPLPQSPNATVHVHHLVGLIQMIQFEFCQGNGQDHGQGMKGKIQAAQRFVPVNRFSGGDGGPTDKHHVFQKTTDGSGTICTGRRALEKLVVVGIHGDRMQCTAPLFQDDRGMTDGFLRKRIAQNRRHGRDPIGGELRGIGIGALRGRHGVVVVVQADDQTDPGRTERDRTKHPLQRSQPLAPILWECAREGVGRPTRLQPQVVEVVEQGTRCNAEEEAAEEGCWHGAVVALCAGKYQAMAVFESPQSFSGLDWYRKELSRTPDERQLWIGDD